MVGRVQDKLILSRGNFYREYITALPVNYSEVLPDFGISGIVGSENGHEEGGEHHESESVNNWEHFSSDLAQYPYIRNVHIRDLRGETIWFYPESVIPAAANASMKAKIRESGAVGYVIASKHPDLIINYYIPVTYDDEDIGIAEIVIKDNNLRKTIESSRLQFALLIFLGGFIFYISLFLLFFKVYSSQNEAIKRLDKSQTLTIRTMSMLAELKDNDTGEHIQRTSAYCRILAEGLMEDPDYRKYITDEYIKDLERSAPLHDIGKVGIPERILLKPGKLTEDEFDIIKKHTELGAQVLHTATESLEFRSFFEIGYQIVLHHHENWDGTGYPHGLKGQDIPLSARIMAVADVYDALTTVRPYKRAFSHEEAMAIILKERGLKFDPRLIENLLRVEAEFKKISEQLVD